MGFAGKSKLIAAMFAGAITAMAQPVAADPIYHLGPEYSVGSGVGSFIIPSVAQGLLFYLNADNPPTEITLTGLYRSDDKVQCTAVTRSTYACSVGAASLGHDGDDEWQSGGRGSGENDQNTNDNDPARNGQPAQGPNGNDPLLNTLAGDVSSSFQIANFVNDPPAGPTSVPEPASLALFATGLIGLGLYRRRKT